MPENDALHGSHRHIFAGMKVGNVMSKQRNILRIHSHRKYGSISKY